MDSSQNKDPPKSGPGTSANRGLSAIREEIPSGSGSRNAGLSQPVVDCHLLVQEDQVLCLLYRGKGLKFSCVCHLKFPTGPALKTHIAVCKKITISNRMISHYRCDKCMESLSSMPKVFTHYSGCSGTRRHFQSEDVTPAAQSSQKAVGSGCFKCRFCGRRFPTSIGRGQHYRHQHASELHLIERAPRVLRWSEAEDNLLMNIEAEVRVEHSLDDAECLDNSIYDEIYDRMKASLPEFTRTVTGMGQRIAKGSQERRSAVRVLMAQKSARRNAHLQDQHIDEDGNDDGSTDKADPACMDDGPMDLPNQTQCLSASLSDLESCKCDEALRNSIMSHLNDLSGNHTGVTDLQNLLVSMLQDLNAYGGASFNILRRKTCNQTQSAMSQAPGTKAGRKRESQPPVGGGRKLKQKSSECGRVRNLLEEQGHKRCLQYLRNPGKTGVCTEATVELFKSVFEHPSGDEVDDGPITGGVKVTGLDAHSIHRPVTAAEVSAQLKRLSKTTAPGPDGVRVKEMLEVSPSDFACLFNIFLLHNDVPKALKVNRTTMIPKSVDPDIGDWRPITVASIVDRLFAKVLEERLSRVVMLDPRQRGFTKSLDGCGENITAYSGALRYARRKGKSLAVVSLDLAKAFDSVKYSTIKRALIRLGVDSHSIALFMNLCYGQTTVISHQSGSAEVSLRRGVRQGWPLSPILFLCVVDELLSSLQDANGFQVESSAFERHYLTGLAFADDIILYSSSTHGINLQVSQAVSWCAARGMRVNPKKSTVLYLSTVPKKKKCIMKPLRLLVEGVEIPQVTDSFERILGVHMHFSGKTDHKIDDFGRDLQLVCSSALRPSQKVSMIQHCLIPMVKFRLVFGMANIGACSQVDRIIRVAVKGLLHLHKSTSDSVLYTSRKQGGIGLTCLKEAVQREQASLALRMMGSSNPITQILADTRPCDEVTRRFASQLEARRVDKQALETLGKRVSEERLDKFKSTIQGAGWGSFYNAPRMYLDNPVTRRWSEKDSIDAHKMRCNMLFTREFAARTVARGQGIDVSCRGCRGPQTVETQSHILSKCPSTEHDRVARHDQVCAYVERRIKSWMKGNPGGPIEEVVREYRVTVQPNEDGVMASARNLRPDLAVILRDRIVIIEVSVVYEAHRTNEENSLKRVRRDKLHKYNVLRKVLKARSGKEITINTLIVGCRGGWLTTNNKVMSGTPIPFTEHDRNCCVERAVRGSLITFHRFQARTRVPLIKHK